MTLIGKKPSELDGATNSALKTVLGIPGITTFILLATSISWIEGEFMGRVANVYALVNTAIDEDVVNNGTVLGIFFIDEPWYPLPFIFADTEGYAAYVMFSYSMNTIILVAFDTLGVIDPSVIEKYKFLIIKKR